MKFLSIATLSIALMLGGCATRNAPPPVSPGQVSDVIATIQTKIAAVCQISADYSGIINLVNAIGVPYVGMVNDIANQVCAAFNRPTVRRRANLDGTLRVVIGVRGRPVLVTGHRL